MFAYHLDPHAAGIMDMAGDHADCASWGSWNPLIPQFNWEVLEEELGHPVACSPGGQQVNVCNVNIHVNIRSTVLVHCS